MVDERIQQAEDLARGSKEYAKAFRLSAHICRVRFPGSAEVRIMSHIFEEKARLEEALCERLAADPIGTLREEGLA